MFFFHFVRCSLILFFCRMKYGASRVIGILLAACGTRACYLARERRKGAYMPARSSSSRSGVEERKETSALGV